MNRQDVIDSLSFNIEKECNRNKNLRIKVNVKNSAVELLIEAVNEDDEIVSVMSANYVIDESEKGN